MSTVTYAGHGHVFRIEAPEPLATRIDDVLQTLRISGREPTGTYEVTDIDGYWWLAWRDEPIGSRESEDALLLLLHWHINQRTIESSVKSFTTLHAAVASSPLGVGVILAAPMESGKTTTCTGLLRRGWSYLTDEAAAVTPDGVVRAYPKPLTIDSGSWPLFPDLRPTDVGSDSKSWLVPVSRIPGSGVVQQTRARLVLFPAYVAGSATTAQPLPPSKAALALAHSAFNFDQNGGRDLRCISALARLAPAYRLEIGDLTEAVGVVESLAKEFAR